MRVLWFSILTLPICCAWILDQGTSKYFHFDKRIPVSSKSAPKLFTNARTKTPTLTPQAMNVPRIEIAAEEDKEIFRILSTANTIAVVGATNRASMPVYGVMLYLQNQVCVEFMDPYVWVGTEDFIAQITFLCWCRDIDAFQLMKRLQHEGRASWACLPLHAPATFRRRWTL
jgi:hypothetical protein